MPAAPSLSTPAYARVRDRLRQDILAGAWPPGEHRPLQRIATELGVSMIPVREALLGLEGEGLVEIRQHRGAVVPLLDAALLHNLYDLRAALQALLARRAAELATKPELRDIAAHADAFARAAKRREPAEALRHNELLHAAIDAAGRNPQVAQLLASRTAFVTAARLRIGYGRKRMDAAAAEHAALLDALRDRNPDQAAKTAFDHAQAAKRDLLARFQEETTPQ